MDSHLSIRPSSYLVFTCELLKKHRNPIIKLKKKERKTDKHHYYNW